MRFCQESITPVNIVRQPLLKLLMIAGQPRSQILFPGNEVGSRNYCCGEVAVIEKVHVK